MVITAGSTGKCPHCHVVNRFERVTASGNYPTDGESYIDEHSRIIRLDVCQCTHCKKIIMSFQGQMIYPIGSIRPNAPTEVPQAIAEDFNEACSVEHLSKKAAAALARRCLQNMLREQGIKPTDLFVEIEEAMKTLPSHLGASIDAIRHIGNFGAHPNKFKITGEVVDVEPEEAEWTLNVLEDLFDFYYVRPAITKAKKDALDAKLKAMGKGPMKQP